jgi:hypothetical protein
MVAHKKGMKEKYLQSGSYGFGKDVKHGFKYAVLAGGGAMYDAGKTLNKIDPSLKVVGTPLKVVGGLEKVTVAAVDSIGAKDPAARYKYNMGASIY